MRRTAKKHLKREKVTADAFKEYPRQCGSADIVLNLLKLEPSAARWMMGKTLRPVQVHHIFGRKRYDQRTDWRCNLIGVYGLCHDYGHDVSPMRLELCCLSAQWELHQQHKAESVGESAFWNLDAINAICGRASLEGRIDCDLYPVVIGTPLESVAMDLLTNVLVEKMDD